MKISFRKKNGNPSLGIDFFWTMTLDAKPSALIVDHFIPELFFDFFFIEQGSLTCVDNGRRSEYSFPQQVFKTVYTHPLSLILSPSLVLFGARFSLQFAETFWANDIRSNAMLEQIWIHPKTKSLDSFERQVSKHVQERRIRKTPYPLLLQTGEESDWLVNFSPRHKRRLYKTVFGLTQKQIQNIRRLHSFVDQNCDFVSQNPRIIQHMDPEVFYDQPHLNHTFRSLTGFSPVEYFQANSILQDNLMSASYNAIPPLEA